MNEILAVMVECLNCSGTMRVTSRTETVENALKGHPAATVTLICPECFTVAIVDLAGLLQAAKEAHERNT